MKDLINDDQTLVSANRNGHPIKTYDDGYGPLWILRDSMGIMGIIRAQTWEDAYEIGEDEMFPDADPEDITEEALIKEYGENFMDNGAFQENYGFRPNGGMYQKDLNGESLDRLTAKMLENWNITLEIVKS